MAILYPTSLANLVVEVGTRHCHQTLLYDDDMMCGYRDDSRFAPSQWETTLLCKDVSHWLGASLESALWLYHVMVVCPWSCVGHILCYKTIIITFLCGIYLGKEMHFHFISFLLTQMAQVVEILPHGWRWPIYPACSMPFTLLIWHHQQLWCCPR